MCGAFNSLESLAPNVVCHRAWVGFKLQVKQSGFTHNSASYLSGSCTTNNDNRTYGEGKSSFVLFFIGPRKQRTTVTHDQYSVPSGPITD